MPTPALEFPHGRKRLLADVAVLSDTDDLLQRLHRASRPGVHAEVKDGIVEPGRQKIDATLRPVGAPVNVGGLLSARRPDLIGRHRLNAAVRCVMPYFVGPPRSVLTFE